MRITVEPARFVGAQLVSQSIGENDYSVSIDGLRAGRILLQPIANGASIWLWTITGPALVQAGLSSSGNAPSLAEARQALRARFDQWLARALAADVAVHWHA